MIVGTSTSCSTSCVTRRAARIGTSRGRILGTTMTCAGSGDSAAKKCSVSGSWSTICGTGTSREGAGRCPTKCRRIRPWGRGASRTWPCSATRASLPALAVFWPRGALWCVLSARAIATLIRAYRRYARKRRSLRRRALPVPPPSASRATYITR